MSEPTDPGPGSAPDERPPTARAALAAVLGLLAAWGGWFIFRTSFLLDGRRVFCLFDDAMISMTYARNLVEGFGLNWARRGAPVEGFTHPLWTALMVPVNLLPVSLERRSLLVQLGCLALLLFHVDLVRRLVVRHFTLPGARHWLPACVLTAAYYPLNFWALIGMEASLQAVLTTASVLLALDIVHGQRDRHFLLLCLGMAAILLRPDMLLMVAAVQIYVLSLDRRSGRRAWHGSGWRRGGLVLFLAVAGLSAFRWFYFHDLLPNTFYLKLADVPLVVRLLRGGSALLDTLRAHGPLLLLVAIGVLPQLFRRGAGKSPESAGRAFGSRLALPAAIFALCCVESVWVGGDAWEDDVSINRFVVFAMPMLFVLFNALCNQAISALALRRWGPFRRGAPPAPTESPTDESAGVPAAEKAAGGESLARRIVLTAATVAAILVANGLWLRQKADENWKAVALLTPPLHVDKYRQILGHLHDLQRIANPAAAIAVTWAGANAFFSDFRMIDELGYNDRHIARSKPALTLSEDNFELFVPGHVKWDMRYVLEVQAPDALLQVWGGRPSVEILQQHGYCRIAGLWVNPHSQRLRLDRATPPGADDSEEEDAGGSSEEPLSPESLCHLAG
jgi:hypothetical protein